MARESSAPGGGPLPGLISGSRVAAYLLEGQVGAGGMATVFRARDERLGRVVALKVLAPGLAADAGFRQRFIRESQAAAAVDDPHIIPVYEAGEADGVLFIAMRFVSGGDLLQVLDREGPLPPGRALGFLSPVASALDAAHAAGLINRDVKPANMLVDTRPGRPDHIYLSDFGLSKGGLWSASLTVSEHFLGTPDYAAPEQVTGPAVDGRTDQYALGCVAFRLLAGVPPFGRDEPMAVLWAHLHEPPPSLISLRPDLPRTVEQVLARAMAKAPQDRYGSCGELAAALRDALGLPPYSSTAVAPGHPPGEAAQPESARPHRADAPARQPSAGAGGPSTIGVPASPGPSLADTIPPTASKRPPRGPGRHRAAVAALTAIVLAAAVIAATLGNPWAHAGLSVATRRVAALPDPISNSLVYYAAFSPDGKLLATADSDGSAYLWDVATHTRIATLPDPHGNGASSVAFSPGGKLLATADDNGHTYLWDVAAHTSTADLSGPISNGSGISSVAFSPDGKLLATADGNDSAYLWDVATQTRIATLPDPHGSGAYYVAFSPDGKLLATADLNGSSYLWDVAAHTHIATLPDPDSNGVVSVAFSPDGKMLATADGNGSTYLWDVAAHTRIAALTARGARNVSSAVFSPDGKLLATADYNGDTYLWDIAERSG